MATSQRVEGVVVAANARNVRVETADGQCVEAIVPLNWFSAKGLFDLCPHCPIGIRVAVLLRSPPKENRVIEKLE